MKTKSSYDYESADFALKAHKLPFSCVLDLFAEWNVDVKK